MAKKRIKLKIKDRHVSEQKLIDAAEEAFSKHGFDGATTRDIANKAGVNIALIARYFDGKYGLLLAVIQRKMNEIQTLDFGPPKTSLSNECVAFITVRFEKIIQDVDFVRIIIAQSLTDEKFLRRFQEIMKLKFENTEFEARLKKLIDEKKVVAKFNASSFNEVLERNIIAIILFEVIMKKMPKAEALDQLKGFALAYAQSFER